MKTMIFKALSGASLLAAIMLTACGTNNCPAGQTMYNNVCVQSQNAYGGNCAAGQLYTQYGCLQTNINGCSGNTAWSPQMNSCVPAIQNNTGYGYNGYNTGYNGYNNGYNGYNGYNTGYGYGTTYCQNGYVHTQAYGCLPQNGCPYGMGMGPFGCTY